MAKTSGSFSGGFDSRRYISTGNGITAYREALAKKLSKHSLEAATIMVKAMKGDTKVTKLQLAAAQDICNRTGGNPVSQLHIAILDSPENKDVTELSNQELERIILLNRPDFVEGEKVINEPPTYSKVDVKASLKASGVSE